MLTRLNAGEGVAMLARLNAYVNNYSSTTTCDLCGRRVPNDEIMADLMEAGWSYVSVCRECAPPSLLGGTKIPVGEAKETINSLSKSLRLLHEEAELLYERIKQDGACVGEQLPHLETALDMARTSLDELKAA